jgi:hypothetical protein
MVTNILRKRHFYRYLELTVVNNFFWIQKMQTVVTFKDHFACLYYLTHFHRCKYLPSASNKQKAGNQGPSFGE